MEPDLIDLESEQQSGANLTPLHIIDIIEQNTDDLLVQTSSQPHSNIVEPSRAVDANAIAPKECNLHHFKVSSTSLSSLLSEEATCQSPKRPRSVSDDDEQTRDGANRINIIGKTLNIAFSIHWGAALEFMVNKLMSGKKYFPKLLEYEFTHGDNIPLDNKINTLLLIFPEYNKEPKQRSIFRTARQLLTAVRMLHEKRIIHSDIAPPNVLWDDNDDLVLIDFGSTFWFNYLPPYEEGTSQCMLRDYGHQGFVPREKVRVPVTDVFTAGRSIEHWANEWNQVTPELNSLIQRWYVCLLDCC